MSIDELLNRIRAQQADAIRRYAAGAGYPDDFKQLVAHYARARREEGATWKAVAEPLPISSTTAQKWVMRQQPPASTIVPVAIIDPPETPPEPSRLYLTSPAGFQLSGFSLQQAVQLLRHLG